MEENAAATLHVPAGTKTLYAEDPVWGLFGTIDDGTSTTPIYNPGDIAVINAIIDNNGLQWTKADPADGSYVPDDWTYSIQSGQGIRWTNDEFNKRIQMLYINQQSLYGSLNVSELTNLFILMCQDNNLTSLDASGLIYLISISCANNNLSSLNISGSTNLANLYCANNQLSSLDVLEQTNFQIISCESNNLTSLNISTLTNLLSLSCNSNNLTSLDVSGLTNLQILGCMNNNLTSLNLAGLNNLSTFVGSNQTYSLDFTGSAGNYTANATFGAGATFDNTALSYSSGVLTSTSNTATTSSFTSPTGLSGFDLTGTLTMTYPATIAVTGVSLSQKSAALIPINDINGDGIINDNDLSNSNSLQLTSDITPTDATNKNVTWQSRNTSVATVTETGLITAIAEGTVAIYVTTEDGAFTDTCYVTVKRTLSSDASLAELTVSQGALSPAFNPAVTEYTVSVADSISSIVLSATANNSGASVDGTGTMPLEPGNNVFNITVTAEDGNTATYTVTVNRVVVPATIAVTGVSLDKHSVSLEIGSSEQLTATVLPSNATNKNVTWKSWNTSVATVTGTGLITALTEGTALINVVTADGSFADTCYVTVKRTLSSDATLAGLTVSQGALTPAFNPGVTEYTVSVADNISSIVLSANANNSAAYVDGIGTMSLEPGINIFYITVTAENGDRQIYTVTVNRAAPPVIDVTGVSLDKSSLEMKTGNTEQLTATVLPSDATYPDVTWSSSDTSVVVVSATGLVTAKGEGTATVKVTTDDGGFTATCSITVSKPDVEVAEETPVSEDGKGKTTLSLTIPANSLFSGSFVLTLPTGMHLDLTVTQLADSLSSLLSLTITQNADGSWLFTIAPLTLRSAKEMVYSRIVEIGYTVDATVEKGVHEGVVSDLSFEFDNGTIIDENELPVTITVNTVITGIPDLSAETVVYLHNGILHVQSPVAETVGIYSISGVLLQNFQKPAGKASFPINQPKGSVLIVKGSTGWVKKLIKN